MTNAATVTGTNLHGALDDEELFIIEGSSCTEQQKTAATAETWRTRRDNVQIPSCELRRANLQLDASAVERLRIRVHRNVENM